MRPSSFSFTVLFFLAALSQAQESAIPKKDVVPHAEPKPIAVVISVFDDAEILRANPTFAIYEDGQVIYMKRDSARKKILLHKRLNAEELGEVRARLHAVGDYSTLKRSYRVFTGGPSRTIKPITMVYLASERQEVGVAIWELFINSKYAIRRPDKHSHGLPYVMWDLLACLTSLDLTDAKPWTPDYVEVVALDYSQAKKKPINWPDDWPGLDSPLTAGSKEGDLYSIFLPGDQIPRLRKLLDNRPFDEPVLIDGRKFEVSYHKRLPGQPLWEQTLYGDGSNAQPPVTTLPGEDE